MQRSQVFKVKGMQRDLSMANTQGEFAYEIVNMRLLPAEEDSGLSLTNEQGTLCVIEGIDGDVLGQCPTSDSLVVFTHGNKDRIYKISYNGTTWLNQCLYEGNLNFQTKIEAIFNYETSDIQKVYWIDGINQLRCINLEDYGKVTWNDSSFDSVKQIDSLPTVEIERTTGGSFVAGVLQYYISYFTEFGSESPIVYTSPLLYLAHENRGGNVNDSVSTAFKLTLSNLDTTNWNSIRIYVTHRTSLDATPEGSIIQEFKIPETGIIEFTDYGLNRISISPTDLYFVGGKFIKAGTMTVKDQVMFLGNLDIKSDFTIQYEEIVSLFEELRSNGKIDKFFRTDTRKQIDNDLHEYQNTYYGYKSQLSNTNAITHYKYGEKYRFGISAMDSYGQWSNPIWIKDEFITISPEQISTETLELPCPELDLGVLIEDNISLWDKLQEFGVQSIKPIVVFPDAGERKVIAQGVVCPTVYNLKDRKENGPYAQASWFMRPNAPVDLWGISSNVLGKLNQTIVDDYTVSISHKSDLMNFIEGQISGYLDAGYYGAASSTKLSTGLTGFDYMYDDFSAIKIVSSSTEQDDWNSKVQMYNTSQSHALKDTLVDDISFAEQSKVYEKGSWVEFRHNYALRSKGWSFGAPTASNPWVAPYFMSENNGGHLQGINKGMVRGAELDVSRFDMIPPTNRFTKKTSSSGTSEKFNKNNVISSNLYFVTTLSPKAFHKAQRNGDQPSVQILYKYTDKTTSREYIQPVDVITMPKEKTGGGGYYVRTSSPWEFMNIPETILPGQQGNNFVNVIRLKARRAASPVELKEGGMSYYIWEFRDVSNLPTEISKDKYIKNFMPDFSIVLNTEDENLYYGDRHMSDLSLGNSSYYVDNSIVTLNSPEIEFTKQESNLANTNFRIIGIIPLTATASDISLQVDSPAVDNDLRGSGLVKRTYSNTNIGYHGFKGIVGSHAYLTNTTGSEYSMTQLSPWHSTGTLGLYDNTSNEFKTKDILKRKVLSNLRYSASTYFFPTFGTFAGGAKNEAILNSRCIGWKPAMGCYTQTFNGEDSSSIVKLNELNYSTESLVYKGNIESIALLTRGSTNDVIPNPIYSFKQNPTIEATDSDSYIRINSPAVGIYKDTSTDPINTKVKTAQGASIKYKSSPHYVIGFKCFDSLWGSTQKVQETLPAWKSLNEEGLASTATVKDPLRHLTHGRLYEDPSVSSLYHQSVISVEDINIETSDDSISIYNLFRTLDSVAGEWKTVTPNYGWLWLGEIYREEDPTFGGTSEFALLNNKWANAGELQNKERAILDNSDQAAYSFDIEIQIDEQYAYEFLDRAELEIIAIDELPMMFSGSGYRGDDMNTYCNIKLSTEAVNSIIHRIESAQFTPFSIDVEYEDQSISSTHTSLTCTINRNENTSTDSPEYSLLFSDLPGTAFRTLRVLDIHYSTWPKITVPSPIARWTIGDTFYQRFDTLKTYAYSDSDQNSVVDITSFMVETKLNIDGRYDRNRGQESNLQMSPTNFNLFNDVYSQQDNFFTYRMLDDDVQNRTSFKNQITWSLSKTAGETIDSWLNVTLASVLDLDGTKGELTALKTFGNNIVAFQDSGISQILFNSRVQIPTSENVPIQIANSGKVDGQQFVTTDIGCQDKWNIVTTSQGLYFIDYRDKSIYKFNGQLANLSATGGFRGWCEKHITDQSTIVGYYDIKNKEVMFYDSNFSTESVTDKVWLGFSEMSNHFSSFYTYPEAYLTRIQGIPVWLYNKKVYQHQVGNYNDLLGVNGIYGLTINTRQDSNLVKTFNTVEFRADTYINKNVSTPEVNATFDTIQIEDEHDGKTVDTLSFNQYRPSNLKKYLRTWRAQIPRVKNKYNRYVNQWAKIGLWKTNPSLEKTILHDMAVWYSE